MITMTPQKKELVAIGISVAAGRRPSMDGYLAASQKTRATREEIKQAVRGFSRRLPQSGGHEGGPAHLGEEREVLSFGFLGGSLQPRRMS
jgi:hypothetical protein